MAPLASVSVASITIGFISFSFTLAIWLHAFWDAFRTLGNADTQVQDALSILRQSLYEEREYLKRKRRRKGGHQDPMSKTLYYEGGPERVISDALKDLIHAFKEYERPFLVTPHTGREKELEWSFDATQQHYVVDFPRRVLWLRVKGRINDIADKLQRIQVRRTAVEVTEMHFMFSDMMGMIREYDHRLGAIEQRLQMSRIG